MLTAFLLIVTFASLALSAGLLTYVLRLTREERDRSEARAASLEQALGGVKPLEPWSPEMTFASDPVRRDVGREDSAARDLDLAPATFAFAAHAASADNPFTADAPSVGRPAAFSSMFGAQAASADDPSAGGVRTGVPRAILVPAVGV